MESQKIKVLLVDDDEDAFFLAKDLLSDVDSESFDVQWVPRYEGAKDELAQGEIDVCLIDHYLGAKTGLELVSELTSSGVDVPLILVTGRGDRQIDLAAMNAGAADYLSKDEITPAVLERSIRYAIQRRRDAKTRSKLEAMLIQGQKLEAIGQLAASIAHEINTPIQYIGTNVSFILNKLPLFFEMFDSSSLAQGDAQKIETLHNNLETALHDCQDGVRRVSEIVRSVREFAHPADTTTRTLCNLNEIIESTVRLARNEFKQVATVDLKLARDIEGIPLVRGRFEQVILNLLINAGQAISERQCGSDKSQGLITIETKRVANEEIVIQISDNGNGIAPKILGKIFDPFFTTKPVGRGTGQGLALAHSVIWKDHGGRITVESEVGKGTSFIIVIPSK